MKQRRHMRKRSGGGTSSGLAERCTNSSHSFWGLNNECITPEAGGAPPLSGTSNGGEVGPATTGRPGMVLQFISTIWGWFGVALLASIAANVLSRIQVRMHHLRFLAFFTEEYTWRGEGPGDASDSDGEEALAWTAFLGED